jgi:DNA-binding response OmpR family regulator
MRVEPLRRSILTSVRGFMIRKLLSERHMRPPRDAAVRPGANEHEAPPKSAQRASSPTIVIVDDDPVIRSIMQDNLEDEGYTVRAAQDGIEACQRCDETLPSLLIVDAVMPRMDGFELCRHLRQNLITQHLPILLATGLDDHGSITKAYEAGATDFIAKPLNWPILYQRIRYMLRDAHQLEDLRKSQQSFRAAQERQRKQNEHLEVALGQMSQGLCMFNADGQLLFSNQRFRDLYCLAATSVLPGRRVAEVLKSSPLFRSQSDGAPNAALSEHLALTARRDGATLTQQLADGRVVAITHQPIPGGGFVDTFTEVTHHPPTRTAPRNASSLR